MITDYSSHNASISYIELYLHRWDDLQHWQYYGERSTLELPHNIYVVYGPNNLQLRLDI